MVSWGTRTFLTVQGFKGKCKKIDSHSDLIIQVLKQEKNTNVYIVIHQLPVDTYYLPTLFTQDPDACGKNNPSTFRPFHGVFRMGL